MGGHDEVTGQRQRKARARCRAFHGSNDRLGETADGLDPVVQALDTLRLYFRGLCAIGLQPVQIAACAEHAAFTGDDHSAYFCAALGPIQRLDPRRVVFRA